MQVAHSGEHATHKPMLFIEKPIGQTQPAGVGMASSSLQVVQLVALPSQVRQVISQAAHETLLKKVPAGQTHSPLIKVAVGSEQVRHAEALKGSKQVAHEGWQGSQVPFSESTRGGTQTQVLPTKIEPGAQVVQTRFPFTGMHDRHGPGQLTQTPGQSKIPSQVQRPLAAMVIFTGQRHGPGEPIRAATGSAHWVQALGSAGAVQVAQVGSQAAQVPLTIIKPGGQIQSPSQRVAIGSKQSVQFTPGSAQPRQPGGQVTQSPLVKFSSVPNGHTHWPLTRVALGSAQDVQANGSKASPQVKHEGSQGAQVLVSFKNAVPLGHTQTPCTETKSPGHAVQSDAFVVRHSMQGARQGTVHIPYWSRAKPGGQ